MSDTRRRSLERSAFLSGDPGDAARVLVEKLRRGELSRERVEAAAYAGHEAARLVLSPFPDDEHVSNGNPTACNPCMALDRRNYTFVNGGAWHCLKHATEHPDLSLWLSGLGARFGVEAQVAAALGAARAALDPWEDADLARGAGELETEHGIYYIDRRPRMAIEAGEAWLARPCDKFAEKTRRWAVDNFPAGGLTPPVFWWGHAVAAIWSTDDPIALAHSVRISVAGSAEIAGEPAVREAAAAAVRAWALGGDA